VYADINFATRHGHMSQPKTNNLPEEILKACLMLGIKPEELNDENIRAAWKRQVSAMARIGDLESATHLRNAKDTLISWLRNKHLWFTPPKPRVSNRNGVYWRRFPDGPSAGSGVTRRPLPTLGTGGIAVPEP
jgi:hypothetical protein